ncbi:uncharacterized protein V6R79_026322 [Siganus canaliculatus]
MSERKDREEEVRRAEAQRITGKPMDESGSEPSCTQRPDRRGKRPVSDESGPEPSCRSANSNRSRGGLIDFQGPPTAKRRRIMKEFAESGPEPSRVSAKSGMSNSDFQGLKPLHVKRVNQEASDMDSVFLRLENNIALFVKNELKAMKKVLCSHHGECLESQSKDEDMLDGEEEEQRKSSREAFLKIVLHFLKTMNQDELAESLQNRSPAYGQHKLKSNLKKFQNVFEGTGAGGKPILLNQIFTELFITEEGTGVSDEHEVRQIETVFKKRATPEQTIQHEDIFKPLPEREGPVKTVMTKGVAGIGKTVLTQKFTLDWAEDKANQDIEFMFPFTFRELNVLKGRSYSLVQLVHDFFPETKGIHRFEAFQVVFIFDGLDECRLPLEFQTNEIVTDVTQSTSVDVLLTNLIKGKLLPSAHLWITTRPAAANQIPSECVDLMTEVRGFTNKHKAEYFKKRFKDEEKASRVIAHIKSSRSLHIMCHIPVFCWISATVLEDVLKGEGHEEKVELPTTLTEMYVHFLVIQCKVRNIKYHGGADNDPHWNQNNINMTESLGKLAFEQLQKGNLVFYESDLEDCGINVKEASVYSGVFTQIFKEEKGFYHSKMFSFVHLSVQEFLAALHVHLMFFKHRINLLANQESSSQRSETGHNESAVACLYQSAVDKALQSPNGHLDLFLRFLLGLSLSTNQTVLRGLLPKTGNDSVTVQATTDYIKSQIEEPLYPERTINLFHCLNELNDRSLVKQIQHSMSSGSLSTEKLSPAQWSALAFIILSSENNLDVFDLKKYSASEEALLRLLPLIRTSKKVLLSGCNLSERSCEALSSVLSSQSSSVKELDLSNNDLKDSGVKLLSEALQSQHCELKSLKLSGCLITKEGCAFLTSALRSKPLQLKELDLRYNSLGDSRQELESAGLADPQWRLDTLRIEPDGEQWLTPGLRKYFYEPTIDTNAINQKLKLSEDKRTVTRVEDDQAYPDHADRFASPQLLCSDALSDRCYWEVEWKGRVSVTVSYKGICRRTEGNDSIFGKNPKSWSLVCCDDGYYVCHNSRESYISPTSSSSESGRVAVYVNFKAGLLSFYRVSSDRLVHLHTFDTAFDEPLYPGFGFWSWSMHGSSVSLCSF